LHAYNSASFSETFGNSKISKFEYAAFCCVTCCNHLKDKDKRWVTCNSKNTSTPKEKIRIGIKSFLLLFF
jgi:hypothetical protein